MKSITVSVFGSDYVVKADGNEDHVVRVADVVDRKMREIDTQFKQPSVTRTAVLACMNIVDEQLSAGTEDLGWVARRVGALIDKMDSVVGTGRGV
jgi:cell division protein ZapA (FtsZ GTPase activity inhibitor)